MTSGSEQERIIGMRSITLSVEALTKPLLRIWVFFKKRSLNINRLLLKTLEDASSFSKGLEKISEFPEYVRAVLR